jgi:hypothetical protein
MMEEKGGSSMKKRMVPVLFLVCLLCLSVGCGGERPSLPRQAPSDFEICYSFWIDPGQKNILDTYTGTIQKDLVAGGTATSALVLPGETLAEIYRKISDLDLIAIKEDMTSKNLSATDTHTFMSPCTYYEFTFTADGKQYTVTGDETAYAYRLADESADNFCAFLDYMEELYRSTKEFLAFPDVVGAYS